MVRKQNKALSSLLALAVCEVAESKWHLSPDACSHGSWAAGEGGAAPVDGRAPDLLGRVPGGSGLVCHAYSEGPLQGQSR